MHLKYAREYRKPDNNGFAMPLDQITRGLEICIQAVVDEIEKNNNEEEI